MTDRREEIEWTIMKLKAQFFEREFYPVLEEEFSEMLLTRRMSLEAGQPREGRVIAVIGGSGSGKTTAVDRLVARHLGIARPSVEDAKKTVVQFNSPNKASGKDVAIEAIGALGYTASATRSEGSLRTLLRGHLQQRDTFVVHIDEAQDLVRFQTQNERERVVKFLKSLLVDKVWPVDLILSGIPELIETINRDAQLKRRTTIIEVPRLQPALDDRDVVGIIHDYASDAMITIAPDVGSLEFAERLIHAANSEFGAMVGYIIGAIRRALLDDAMAISTAHFAKIYERKTNCPRTANPFLEKDFERIDVKAWLISPENQT